MRFNRRRARQPSRPRIETRVRRLAWYSDVPNMNDEATRTSDHSRTALTAGSTLGGLVSTAVTSACNAGPATSASLIVSLNSRTLESMTADANYTGALTLVVAPE